MEPNSTEKSVSVDIAASGDGTTSAPLATGFTSNRGRKGPRVYRNSSTRAKPRRSSIGRAAVTLATRSVVALAVIGLWLMVTGLHWIAPVFIPTPYDLWASVQAMGPELPGSIQYSVTITLSGFAIGVSVGLLLGLGMAYSVHVRNLFGGFFTFVRPVPIFALIPLFVLWFGIGWQPQVALIALGTSVIMGVTTTDAVRNVPTIFVKAALTLGAKRRHVYRTVILHSIVPHLVGAIRVAAAASWGLDVAAEFIGAQTGLGHLMIVREEYLDTAGIFVVVLFYALLAIVLDRVIAISTRRLVRWTERDTSTGVVSSLLGGG